MALDQTIEKVESVFEACWEDGVRIKHLIAKKVNPPVVYENAFQEKFYWVVVLVPFHKILDQEFERHEEGVGEEQWAGEQQGPGEEVWVVVHLHETYFLGGFVVVDLLEELVKVVLVAAVVQHLSLSGPFDVLEFLKPI